MSIISLLRPGAAISTTDPDPFKNGSEKIKCGTLTCFVRKPSKDGALYGVTAKHVMNLQDECTVCGIDPSTGQAGSLAIGKNPTHDAAFDFLYFKIYADIRQRLTAENFIPCGYTVEPLQVWNTGKVVTKMTEEPDDFEKNHLLNKETRVQMVGGTQAPRYPAISGLLKICSREKTTIREISLAPSDSGGCVLDAAGLRYVGLLSQGNGVRSATSGHVLMLHDRLMQAGLVLASWADRGHWL